MSAALTFPDVTPAQYKAIRATAKVQGIGIAGASGAVSYHGCDVAYSWAGWDGCSGAPLTLTLLRAPFLCGGIALGELHDLVESVLTAPQSPEGVRST